MTASPKFVIFLDIKDSKRLQSNISKRLIYSICDLCSWMTLLNQEYFKVRETLHTITEKSQNLMDCNNVVSQDQMPQLH